MSDTPISSKELYNYNNQPIPKKVKDFSSYDFWYYTSNQTARLILENKCIHISNISSMNDLEEINIHSDSKDFVHCLCLCNSKTEKIPMWYLYSGISGNGCALGFTPGNMLELLKSIETVSTVDGKTILKKDKDFELKFGWVFYRKKKHRTQILYRNKKLYQ